MAGIAKGQPQAAISPVTVDQMAALNPTRTRETSGPAGGLLIAVGTSLILWAIIAEAAKLASALFF